MIAIKRLTENDISWFNPRSKSHQSGINLPLKSLKQMFTSLYENKSENAPREGMLVSWHLSNGGKIVQSDCEIIMYHSKNELRMVGIPKKSLGSFIETDTHLLFTRDDSHLNVTILSSGFEFLFSQLGLDSLIQKLPPKKD